MGLGVRRFFAEGSWSDLRSRLISAVVLGLFVALLVFAGGWGFRLLCCATGFIVFDEWSRITRARRLRPHFTFGRRVFYLSLVLFAFGFALAALLVLCAGTLFLAFIDRNERKADWLLLGLCYAGAATFPAALLRGADTAGLLSIGFVVTVVWASDIFAYFAGRSIGGPKLMPRVSPKKTMSGALGGLAAAVALGSLFAYAATGSVEPRIVALAAILSVAGQAGDLYESWIKRRFGVKDSGRLIPGHGGLMDRIDALIVATTVAWGVGVAFAGFDQPAFGLFPV
ncbi:phosphatidate cytidylyltransferase [Jiella sonneratiae]|uniref:Phosphatidate cytidylyltransferase n=1 Tax=Jiella sonneratiae TaxID=2816856 RepID=A0ABS3J611_9HYPH|nr:phosphatidate cytidylyltransferase [Jiella sonneratiae]MBO0905109.1 phosphatidate cytidylyltransferase [Jiella sonneratiae]